MSRETLHARAAALITRLADGSRDDPARDALLHDMRGYQLQHVQPYARLCQQHDGEPPALPTDVFRFTRVAAHDAALDVATFRTSGTTSGQRGQHHLRDLSLYDLAAQAAARYALFPDRARMRLLILAPSPDEVADSSLSYMLGRIMDWFGDEHSQWVWTGNGLRMGRLRDALNLAQAQREPLALLGTSFAFVHADEQLNDDSDRRFALPAGSRIMQTGGFKGRSRELQAGEMLDMLSARYGVGHSMIIQEYGMTELCSQMYETTLRDAVRGDAIGPRRLWVPGWVSARAVEPESLRPASTDGSGTSNGLLRIDDVANLDTACAIQTSDLVTIDRAGMSVHGRASDAVQRGCSLAVEEALGGTQ